MKLTAEEIARIVNGELVGNGKVVVTGVASLQQATLKDLSFLGNPKYLKDLSKSEAGVLLLKKGIPSENPSVIYVDNPQIAFSKILEMISKEKEDRTEGIHPSAVISRSAKISPGVSVGAHAVIEEEAVIGEGTAIGALCYIGKRTSVGKNCTFYPHVTIREEIIIHDRVIIHPGAMIGSDGFGYATENKIHHKIPQIGIVEIFDDVEIGANVTIDRATIGKTEIGRGSKIDNMVHVAHNVKIGEGCILAAQSGIAGSSCLGDHVIFAGQGGAAGPISIGDGVIAAAQSGIPNDVTAGSIIFGTPARPIQEERKIQAIISQLPKIYGEFKKIKKLLKIEEEPSQ